MQSLVLAPLPTRAVSIIAIGASSGGVTAIEVVLAGLPATLDVPVVVVQHLDPHHSSMIAEIMERRSDLHAVEAEDGMVPVAGTVYFAPPDRHLTVKVDGTLDVRRQTSAGICPSIDVLFESVANAHRAEAVGVVLTGLGHDGAAGIRSIHERGGFTIAQDPATSHAPSMPTSAIDTGAIDSVLLLDEIADSLLTLIHGGPHG